MVKLPVAERAHVVVGVGQAITERENKIKVTLISLTWGVSQANTTTNTTNNN